MFKLVNYALPFAVLFSSVTFGHAQTSSLTIPKALQAEHHELFDALESATKAGGKAGEAAQRAMAVLKPHFEKEERFALPQLGALEALTKKDATLPNDLRDDLIKRSEAFRAGYPPCWRSTSRSLQPCTPCAMLQNRKRKMISSNWPR